MGERKEGWDKRGEVKRKKRLDKEQNKEEMRSGRQNEKERRRGEVYCCSGEGGRRKVRDIQWRENEGGRE